MLLRECKVFQCRDVLRAGTNRGSVIRNNPALPREQPVHAVEGTLRRRRELRNELGSRAAAPDRLKPFMIEYRPNGMTVNATDSLSCRTAARHSSQKKLENFEPLGMTTAAQQ